MTRQAFSTVLSDRSSHHLQATARASAHSRVASGLRLVMVVLAALLLVAATAAAGTLRGRVVDPDGQPVPGARVLLARPIGVAATATTGSDGLFVIEEVGAGKYDLLVVYPGFQGEPLAVTLADGEEREVTVALRVSGITESVVVSAAQVDVPLSRATDSVAVVTGAEMAARQQNTIAEALRSAGGLALAGNGGHGSVTSLFPRGGESDFTLVMVDGIPVNAFGGGMDMSTLPIAGIDRVEIVRGPQSALFGSDAIGGVVQVVTRHGGQNRVEGSINSGSLQTTYATASAAGSTGGWSWGGAAGRASSRGFRGRAPATGEMVTNDDWLAWHGSVAAGWRSSRGTDVRVNAAAGRSERGFPGPFGSNPLGTYTGIDRVSRGTSDTKAGGVRAMHTFQLGETLFRPRVHATWFEGSSRFESLFGLSDASSRRLTARAQADFVPLSPVRLSAGLEVKGERASSTFITGETPAPIPVRRRILGGFVEAAYRPLAPVSVTAGVRVEHIRRERLEANLSPFVERPAFDADTVTSANPKVSFAWQAIAPGGERPAWQPSSLRIRAAAGTGIRPPDALEIAFTDNPRLSPERSRSAEGGIEASFGRAESVSLSATAFFNDYDDLIVAVGPDLRDASRYRTDNISNARSRGLEVLASARTGWGLEGRLGYTFLRTAILAVDRLGGLAPSPFEPGDRLLRRPEHLVSFDVLFVRGRLSAFALATARGRTLDVEPTFGASGGLFSNPGYAAANAGIGWKMLPAIELTASVSNLFDRRYEETFGFPAPRRAFMVGVRVASGR